MEVLHALLEHAVELIDIRRYIDDFDFVRLFYRTEVSVVVDYVQAQCCDKKKFEHVCMTTKNILGFVAITFLVSGTGVVLVVAELGDLAVQRLVDGARQVAVSLDTHQLAQVVLAAGPSRGERLLLP